MTILNMMKNSALNTVGVVLNPLLLVLRLLLIVLTCLLALPQQALLWLKEPLDKAHRWTEKPTKALLTMWN